LGLGEGLGEAGSVRKIGPGLSAVVMVNSQATAPPEPLVLKAHFRGARGGEFAVPCTVPVRRGEPLVVGSPLRGFRGGWR
jgi:hypothetical protein